MRYFATRSLTEPVGLSISSLAKMRTSGFGLHPRDLDERRVADRLEDVVVPAAVRVSRHGRGGGRGRPRPAATAPPSVSPRPWPAAGGPRRSGRRGVSRPGRYRTSCPLTYTLTKRFRSPSAVSSWPPSAGCRSTSRSTTERIESPSMSSDLTPPTFARRTAGMKTVLTRAPPARRCLPVRSVVSRNGASAPTVAKVERASGLARGGGLFAADRAVRVAPQLELGELRLERIEQHEPAGERIADAEQHLERLVGLEQAQDARDDAEDTGHGAAGCELGWRRGRIEAAVARP